MSILPPSPELTTAAQKFITFLNKAVTPFHAVRELGTRLASVGFVELRESEAWNLKPNGRYYVTKNDSTIMAFAVGGKFKIGSGFSMVVGHTDSPSLRIKPISSESAAKFLQVGVSTYGGGIWRSWFDRDLAVAGEVIYKRDGHLHNTLVDSRDPVLFIPNLAIHLEPNREKTASNNETELRPILCTEAMAKIQDMPAVITPDGPNVIANHHPAFLYLIGKLANCAPEEIVDLDLYLYDSQPAAITGLYKEFICSQRLDNLVGAYTSIEGLIESLSDGSLENDFNVRVAAAYDNEEVGSASAQGAESNFNEWCLRRIFNNLGDANSSAFERGIGRSFLISADQAHACHPNYAARHEDNHRPSFHSGVVVKINVNQRYATTSTTHSILKEIANSAKVPLQQFVVRNDCSCGSTVGPMMATKLGLRTVDVGCPQLAMHSIREFADTSSIFLAIKLYSEFYHRLPEVLDDFKPQLQFVGLLIGTFTWGYLSDSFGRKPIGGCSIGLALSMTGFAVISPSWKWLLASRFILGFSLGGILVACYTFAMELLLSQQRMFLRAVFNWGIARICLTIICFFFNDWRTASFVCMIVGSPALLLIVFVLPESPTWLHYNDKLDEMRKSEKRICKLAGKEFKNIKHEPVVEQKKFKDIVKDRKMFKRVFILWIMWFVVSITGYAIDLGSGNISGNLFVNQIVFAILITVSKYFILILDSCFPKFSRRNLHQGSQLVAIFCFVILISMVLFEYKGVWVLIISVIGICFIEFCWDACYLCGVEAMPTAMRASTLGSCSLIARIGSIFSPLLVQLNMHFSGAAYVIVLILGILNLFVSYNWLIETKNINLDNVDIRDESTEVKAEAEEDELLG